MPRGSIFLLSGEEWWWWGCNGWDFNLSLNFSVEEKLKIFFFIKQVFENILCCLLFAHSTFSGENFGALRSRAKIPPFLQKKKIPNHLKWKGGCQQQQMRNIVYLSVLPLHHHR